MRFAIAHRRKTPTVVQIINNTHSKQIMKKKHQFLIVLFVILFSSCEKDDRSPEPEANFSESYIAQHRGNYFIEIPEVYELANIIMAVKYQNFNDGISLEKNTSYYQSVLDHFNPYRSTDLFRQLNYSETDYLSFLSFRDNSYMYMFSDDQIMFSNTYLREIWDSNIFEKHIGAVQSFAKESNFQEFYNENSEFYNSQIALYDSLIPVKHMWNWLETSFTSRIDCYKIIISPLTADHHSTTSYESNDYKETLMFVQGLNPEIDTINTMSIALIIRRVFTEIDHNYVNPVTDKHVNELNKSMANLNSWRKLSDDNAYYDDAYSIFNEYMTWAVYDLYISEFYSPNNYDSIRNRTVNSMENIRGFIKFREFEDYLIISYKNRADNEKIEDLYPQIIDWISKNN